MVKEYSQVPTVYSSIVETKMFCKKSKSDLMAFESDKLSAELQRWAAMLHSREYHSRQNHCGTKIHNYSTNRMLVCGQCYCHNCIQHENVWERTLLDTQLRMTLRYGIIKHCCIHHLTWQISLCSTISTMSVRGFLRWTLLPCLRTQWPKFMLSFSQTWCVHWSFRSCWTLGMSVWVNVVLYPRLVEFCMPTSCTCVKCKLWDLPTQYPMQGQCGNQY